VCIFFIANDYKDDLMEVKVGGEEGEDHIEGRGGLMISKLDRLVQELRKVQEQDKNAKCLVFSQFSQGRFTGLDFAERKSMIE
jgi:hypothetical protein